MSAAMRPDEIVKAMKEQRRKDIINDSIAVITTLICFAVIIAIIVYSIH